MLSEKDALYRTFELVVTMVRARGQQPLNAEVASLSREDFWNAHWRPYLMDHKCEVELGDGLVLALVRIDTFKKQDWKALVDDMEARAGEGAFEADTVIIVVSGAIALPSYLLPSKSFRTELFEQAHMLLDVIHHRLQPKFQRLTTDEVKEVCVNDVCVCVYVDLTSAIPQVLERYNAVLTQLPVMRPEDPVARYFALNRGDVIMCVRDSETAGKVWTRFLIGARCGAA